MKQADPKKQCSRCRELKSLLFDFGKDGAQGYCVDCRPVVMAEWRARNPERARKLYREAERRRRANPERLAVRREQQREAKRRARAKLD